MHAKKNFFSIFFFLRVLETKGQFPSQLSHSMSVVNRDRRPKRITLHLSALKTISHSLAHSANVLISFCISTFLSFLQCWPPLCHRRIRVGPTSGGGVEGGGRWPRKWSLIWDLKGIPGFSSHPQQLQEEGLELGVHLRFQGGGRQTDPPDILLEDALTTIRAFGWLDSVFYTDGLVEGGVENGASAVVETVGYPGHPTFLEE